LEPFRSARVLQLQDPLECYGISRGAEDGHGWVVIVRMVHLKSEVVYFTHQACGGRGKFNFCACW